MLCRECPERYTCSELCKEAEEYVNQDSGQYHQAGELRFTPTEKRILNMLMLGHTRKSIRKELRIVPSTLRRHIANLRKKREHIAL